MTDKEFFDFCYNQYRAEIQGLESIYRRGAFLLTSQAVLGGMAYSLSGVGYVWQVFSSIDAFLYYATTVAAWVLVGLSVSYMLMALMPRGYPDLEVMPEWVKWRERMIAHLQSVPEGQKDVGRLFGPVVVRMAGVQQACALKNEIRRQKIRKAIIYAALAMACIAGQGICLFILRVREAINV